MSVGSRIRHCNRGQASVELLGSLPALLMVLAMAWQLVLAGQTAWLAANAAKVGARAQAVGKDPRKAARSALPDHLKGRLVVRARDGSVGKDKAEIRVKLPVPLLLYRWSAPLSVAASAGPPQEPG